ncbi:Cathepsin_B [Hexamita inflata]|uniref:Cathepsin_B n=1 Tax=Hexamita inflata TaxID=28002 RepID=A0ABP1H6D2_9EUKA
MQFVLSLQSRALEQQYELLLNIPGLAWKPSINFVKSHPFLQRSQNPSQRKYVQNMFIEQLESFNSPLTAPESFDWTSMEPSCMKFVTDTGNCPSYNSAAEVQALSDLRCIQARDPEYVQYSVQQLIDCEYGCYAGLTGDAWKFMLNSGVPTESCVPFESKLTGKSKTCSTSCKNGSPLNVVKPTKLKKVEGVESQMMKAVVQGPLSVEFDHYEDLAFYSSGIYTHTYGEWIDRMGAEIVGYGEENGIKFWKVKMPLGEQFGENGFMKIAKGTGECKIESNGILGVV